jgi:uncharacterized membrane protein required for colicin V production
MDSTIATQINWIDILIVIILSKICYTAFRTGLKIEIFKLLGTLASVYLALHYYTNISDNFRGPNQKLPLEFMDFLSFIVLLIVGYLVFFSLRLLFFLFIKIEAEPNINKWVGLVLGIARGFLTASLIAFLLMISSLEYLKTSVKSSYLGRTFIQIAPNTYTWIWNSITSKFMVQEKFNDTIREVQEELVGK